MKNGKMLGMRDSENEVLVGLRRHMSSLMISTGAFDDIYEETEEDLDNDENKNSFGNKMMGKSENKSDPKLKRCKSASLTWDDCTWNNDFLSGVVESQEEAALSSQVIDLLESPREGKEPNYDDSTDNDPKKRLIRRATFSIFPKELSGDVIRGGEDHLRLRRESGVEVTPPGWEPFAPSQGLLNAANGITESESSTSSTDLGELGLDGEQGDMDGATGASRRPMLRRVNSAELVRRAFPEMLFDRVSVAENANRELGILGGSDSSPPRTQSPVDYLGVSSDECESDTEQSIVGSENDFSSSAGTSVTSPSTLPSPTPQIQQEPMHYSSHSSNPAFGSYDFFKHQQEAMLAAAAGSNPLNAGMDLQQQQQLHNQILMNMQLMMLAQQQAQLGSMSPPGMFPPMMMGSPFGALPHQYYGQGANGMGMFTPSNGGISPPNTSAFHNPLQSNMPNHPQQRSFHHHPQQQHRQTRRPAENSWNVSGNQPGSQSPLPICSALLAEHKHSGLKPTVSELKNHVLEFAKDSHGSRYLQEVMQSATPEEKTMLIEEIKNDCLTVIQDLFGNYVLQNFLEHAGDDQRLIIAKKMQGVVVSLSMHPHGCRVVQKVFELVPPGETRTELLKELIVSNCSSDMDLEHIAKDAHATHVLQKAVMVLQKDVYPFLDARHGRGAQFSRRSHGEGRNQIVKPSGNSRLVAISAELLRAVEDVVAEDVMTLAVNQHACRLVQCVLGDCDRTRSKCVVVMMDALESQFDRLAHDQHGNFILQHILEFGQDDQAERIQEFVSQRAVALSQHKFGSHLVEKSLITANARQAHVIVEQLLNTPSNVLTKLLKDAFANFVMQKAFEVSTPEQRARIEQEVFSRSELLSQFPHGRHVIAHIARRRSTPSYK